MNKSNIKRSTEEEIIREYFKHHKDILNHLKKNIEFKDLPKSEKSLFERLIGQCEKE